MSLTRRRLPAAFALRLSLLLPLLLGSCGDLPEPFLGNPGAVARRLAQPPTPRLAVPAPGDMMLPDVAGRGLAEALASDLQGAEVPAVAQPAQRTDWTLSARAEQRGSSVVPVFTVRDPQGQDKGNTEGAPVPVATWAAADPATLRQTAAEAAPKIAALLTGIQTAIVRADPNSLYNRPAKVMVANVSGAPGDGNAALTREMRKRLGVLGPVVQTTATGADFIVQGQVKVVPIEKRQERVEIQWVIKKTPDDERGRVVQLNEIPAGTLDHYWGDVAVVVATEASRGVENVLERQTGHGPPAASEPEPAGSPPGDTAGAASDSGQAAAAQNAPTQAGTTQAGTTQTATPQTATARAKTVAARTRTSAAVRGQR
jgi:hypothetical protein